jgi:hypothetical protein
MSGPGLPGVNLAFFCEATPTVVTQEARTEVLCEATDVRGKMGGFWCWPEGIKDDNEDD